MRISDNSGFGLCSSPLFLQLAGIDKRYEISPLVAPAVQLAPTKY